MCCAPAWCLATAPMTPGCAVHACRYGELAVARAIGSAHIKRDPSKRALIPTPEVHSVQLQAEDDFVVLSLLAAQRHQATSPSMRITQVDCIATVHQDQARTIALGLRGLHPACTCSRELWSASMSLCCVRLRRSTTRRSFRSRAAPWQAVAATPRALQQPPRVLWWTARCAAPAPTTSA